MDQPDYLPEKYWDAVANQIAERGSNSLIAGDNDPYYTYKREKFLQLLSSIDFTQQKVLEVGCGPGGNLIEVDKQRPAVLAGVDISAAMVALCKKNTAGIAVQVEKTDGKNLRFEQGAFDIIFTSTVLQHITDEKQLAALIADLCRVSGRIIYLFERIEKRRNGQASNIGRTIKEYEALLGAHSFRLQKIAWLNVYWSRIFCGAIRKVFNAGNRKEGEKESRLSVSLQKMIVVVTKRIDKWIPVKNDVAMLYFERL